MMFQIFQTSRTHSGICLSLTILTLHILQTRISTHQIKAIQAFLRVIIFQRTYQMTVFYLHSRESQRKTLRQDSISCPSATIKPTILFGQRRDQHNHNQQLKCLKLKLLISLNWCLTIQNSTEVSQRCLMSSLKYTDWWRAPLKIMDLQAAFTR